MAVTIFLVAVAVLAIWWLVTASHRDEPARRRRGPERPWTKSHVWLDKLKAANDARRKRDAETATKQELRNIEQREQEDAPLPDDIAAELERIRNAVKRDRQGKKPAP